MTVGKKKSNPRSKSSAADAGRDRARRVYQELLKLYPQAQCALQHRNAYELLIATILSAQCTDARVNLVTPALFKKYPDPAAMAQADLGELEQAIRSTGFFRNKARNIQGACRVLVAEFQGRVPRSMEELTTLPGVARKTANVVLGNAFGVNAGVVVDTHVTRLAQRLGLSRQREPGKIEQDLMALFPPEQWTLLAHLLIHHGRQLCVARKPRCEQCPLAPICPKIGVK